MKNKLLVLACFFFTLGFILQSCDEEDDTPQIGISLKEITNDWHKALRYYANNKLNELNITYTYAGVDGDATQGNIIKSMSGTKECEALIISPEEDLTAEEVNVAITQGASVIFLEKAIGNNYSAVVKTDNEKAGINAATFINGLREIASSDSIVVLDMSEENSEASNARVKGFAATIQYRQRVMSITDAVYTFNYGKALGKEILANHPDITAVYAQDDEVALGILEAIDEETNELKKTQIKVIVGCGGSQLFLNQILTRENITLATTSYSPKMMEQCVELAAELINGNGINKEYLSEPELIDINNAESFLDWNSPY